MPQGGRKRARREQTKVNKDICQIRWLGDGVEDSLGCTTYEGAAVTQPGQKSSVTYRPGDDVLVQTAAAENVSHTPLHAQIWSLHLGFVSQGLQVARLDRLLADGQGQHWMTTRWYVKQRCSLCLSSDHISCCAAGTIPLWMFPVFLWPWSCRSAYPLAHPSCARQHALGTPLRSCSQRVVYGTA